MGNESVEELFDVHNPPKTAKYDIASTFIDGAVASLQVNKTWADQSSCSVARRRRSGRSQQPEMPIERKRLGGWLNDARKSAA